MLSAISFAQISATHYVIVSNTNSYDGDCRGFDFTPKKDIYIQEFGKRVPNTTGNYTWVVWNVNTQTQVHQQNSILSAGGAYIYELSDSVIKLDSGITYSMSMYCDNTTGAQYYYGASSQINTNLTYVAMRYCNSCTPATFPTSLHSSAYHYGTPDFIFECYHTPEVLIDSACFSYTSPSGNHIWTSSGIYYDTIAQVDDCDSIIMIDLLIKTVDTTVVKSGITLTANTTNAKYQWINCNTMTPLVNDTLQAFTASVNGDYAVIITENGCTDTSACYTINSIGIEEVHNLLQIYPNPTSNNFSLLLDKQYTEIQIRLTDVYGKLILSESYSNKQKIDIDFTEKAGVYLVEINCDGIIHTEKLIKQ